jgi:hypothetical protein
MEKTMSTDNFLMQGGMMKQKFLSFFFTLVFVGTSFTFSEAVQAGRYELIKGKGVEVCEAYRKNLNSFNPHEPMICERQINSEMKDFKKSQWRNISEEQTFSLFMEENAIVLRSTGSSKTEAQKEGFTEWVREQIKDQLLVMQTTQLDIDNDSAPETVLKERNGDCPMHQASSASFAVLTKDGQHYDLEKSRYVNDGFSRVVAALKKDIKPESAHLAGMSDKEFVGDNVYDVFLYQDKTYFDMWVTGVNSGRLYVFLRKDGRTKNICAYRFKQK